jgi:hypothetical protein
MVFGHRERDHNTGGVGTIGYVQNEGKSFTIIRSGEGARGLSWKPFGVQKSREVGCVDAQTSEA